MQIVNEYCYHRVLSFIMIYLQNYATKLNPIFLLGSIALAMLFVVFDYIYLNAIFSNDADFAGEEYSNQMLRIFHRLFKAEEIGN